MMPNGSLATSSHNHINFVRVEKNAPAFQGPGSSNLHTDTMGSGASHHQEAYYLFVMGAVGVTLNLLVIVTIVLRRSLRKMTSAFLVHACFLNLLKSAYCVPFGVNLLSDSPPSDCNFEGSSYVVIVTTSAFNMVAMICAEAYTFGENNVGGKSRGSFCCVLFGVLMVYICSLVLHLGPTLIGGYFQYNPDIGNCSFRLGEPTGYIANVMWVCIVSLSLAAVGHFLYKMYKEIQENQPNRVSMLVRTSITIMDDAEAKRNSGNIRVLVKEASHRAKIFVITVITYICSWYPLFLLTLVDVNFQVSPVVYQAFSFVAWTQGSIEPLILICFDRQVNLLARWVYCDRYKKYDPSTLAYLMAQNRGPIPGEDCSVEGNVTTTTYNCIAYNAHGGAAAYPYHDDDEGVSVGSTRHPSPPSELHYQPDCITGDVRAPSDVIYGNQRHATATGRVGNCDDNTRQVVTTARLEVQASDDVEC